MRAVKFRGHAYAVSRVAQDEGGGVGAVLHENEDQSLVSRPILSVLAFEGSEPVADARHAARRFMTEVQAVQGIPVSDRAIGAVQLVVSELVTNAYKYAPGPCLLDLEVSDGAVEISVWDSDPTLPAVRAADPGRIGQHGLEIVMGVCRSFEVCREPVGKRVRATVVLADDPGGHPAGCLL
jgi:anti-sigma regulatory factor (Ser/Thr protein kinase)